MMTERFCPKSERRSQPKETNYCDRNMYLPRCHSQEQKAPIALNSFLDPNSELGPKNWTTS